MSLSKELTSVTVERQLPRCTRCRHHGIIIPLKGHIKHCPFLKCDCWKCFLISERTRTTTLQRNLKKDQQKEQKPSVQTGDGVEKPAACSALLAADGAARRDGTLERAATPTCSPSDPRSRAAGVGSDSRRVLPIASGEGGPSNVMPLNAPHPGEFVHGPPLPVIYFLFNVPWLPPVPIGLHSDGLRGPLMFPHFPPGAVHHPPPPEPGPPADCRRVYFTLQPPPLPESFQEELTSRHTPQPPRFKHTERDIEE